MEAEFHDYENNNKWVKIFQNMNSMSKSFSTKEARKAENRILNRYLDVVPYDDTRVKLERNNKNYINASHVEVPSANRRYILSQGPLNHTSSHFWLMVWEQNTRAILMLNNLIECGHVKCHQYWPNGKQNDGEDELIFSDVNLSVEFISIEKFGFYLLRKFKITDLLNGKSREILHFHYTHWPDFDLPKTSDSFLEFLDAVRASGSLNVDLYGPPVIHCSAGIGRSGTFVLVDTCLVMIEKNNCRDSINIIDTLLDLRRYRMGLIQTADQLRFSFLAIIEGSRNVVQKEVQTCNNNNTNSTTTKIMRSFGVNEEEDPPIENDNEIVLDETNINSVVSDEMSRPNSPEETELRSRKENPSREEKRQKTLDTINRIKRKQKEVEERLQFNQKLYKYMTTSVVCLGVAVCVGVFIFVKKRDSILINYE